VRLLMDLGVVQRPDLEKNGLKGSYDFNLHWRSAQGQAAMTNGTEEVKPGHDNARQPEPSIFTAIQEQLGLKLVSIKSPVQVLVIDHVEEPSEN
jgi:bla regulator protein blaR1